MTLCHSPVSVICMSTEENASIWKLREGKALRSIVGTAKYVSIDNRILNGCSSGLRPPGEPARCGNAGGAEQGPSRYMLAHIQKREADSVSLCVISCPPGKPPWGWGIRFSQSGEDRILRRWKEAGKTCRPQALCPPLCPSVFCHSIK